MEDCKIQATPLDEKRQLVTRQIEFIKDKRTRDAETAKDDPLVNIQDYQCIVGSLMYAMVCTRPDIAFAVGYIGRFALKPRESHLKAAKRILRYLQGTKEYGLVLNK